MNAHKNIYLYYFSYIGPISFILLANVSVFCRVFRVLYKQTQRSKSQTAKVNGATARIQLVKISPSQIKGATAVFVLLGIGWILGLVAIGPFEVFFRYAYVVTNGAQGLLIFLFRVVFNPHACKQWKKVMLGLSPDGSLDVSVTTSSTASGRWKWGIKGKGKDEDATTSPNFISAANSVENSLTAGNPLTKTLAETLANFLNSEKQEISGHASALSDEGEKKPT